MRKIIAPKVILTVFRVNHRFNHNTEAPRFLRSAA